MKRPNPPYRLSLFPPSRKPGKTPSETKLKRSPNLEGKLLPRETTRSIRKVMKRPTILRMDETPLMKRTMNLPREIRLIKKLPPRIRSIIQLLQRIHSMHLLQMKRMMKLPPKTPSVKLPPTIHSVKLPPTIPSTNLRLKTPSMKQTMKPTTKRPPKTPSMKPRSMPLLPTPSTKLPPTRFQNRGTHWWSSRRRRSCRRFSGVSRQTKTVGLAEELRTEWKRALAKLTAGVKCVKWCSNGTSHKTVLRVVRKGESFAVGVREDVHRRLNGRGRREC